jgi:hypothetical protein
VAGYGAAQERLEDLQACVSGGASAVPQGFKGCNFGFVVHGVMRLDGWVWSSYSQCLAASGGPGCAKLGSSVGPGSISVHPSGQVLVWFRFRELTTLNEPT